MKNKLSVTQYLLKDKEKINTDLREAQELIYQVLEHISAGRHNENLMKQKLIQAVKNLNLPTPLKLSKYF